MTTNIYFKTAATIGLLSTNLFAGTIGDRSPETHCRFPDRVMMDKGQGGRIMDITKPPFNAKGDGKTDDTAALIAAYDFCLAKADEAGWRGGKPKGNCDFIIYLPNGTYLVTNTIIYSGPARTGRKPNRWEQVAQIRFVGESRQNTVILLGDNANGYNDPESIKPVLSFAKSTFNNHKAWNAVRNLTIDTGTGNSGATGLNFAGANMAEMKNLTIRSGDGEGAAGIVIKTAPTIGYHHDITIEGFDTGLWIDCFSRATHLVFEHLTCRNQSEKSVIVSYGGSVSMRSCMFEKAPLGIAVEGGGAQCIITDSTFDLSNDHKPVVQIHDGAFYGRNLQGSSSVQVKRNGKAVTETKYGEFIAFPTPSPSPGAPLNLDVPESPLFEWYAPEEWACPEDFGAVPGDKNDNTKAVQAALNSGKPMIYFPAAKYNVSKPLKIPASVRRINGLFHSLNMTLVVEEMSEQPVLIEDSAHVELHIKSSRPIVGHFSNWLHCRNFNKDVTHLFLSNTGGPDNKFNSSGGKVKFCGRAINNEGKTLPLTLDKGDYWFLGFKTERGKNAVHLTPNSRGEFLGGTFGVKHRENYFTLEKGSSVWFVADTSGFGMTGDEVILRTTGEDKKAMIRASKFSKREDKKPQIHLSPTRADF